MGDGVFSGHRLPMLIGILANGGAAVCLVALLFLSRMLQRSSSRVLITLAYLVINVAFTYYWGTRYIDAETSARSDGVEVFVPEPVVGTVAAAFGAAAVGMYSRLNVMGAGGANVVYSIGAGIALLMAARTASFGVSVYWWVWAALATGVVALQMLLWALVPDTQNPRHTKRARRTGFLPLAVVGCFVFYLCALLLLQMLGSTMTAHLDSDRALYKWLFLAAVALPLPLGSPVFTIATYWNDVTSDDDDDTAAADFTSAEEQQETF